MTTRHLSQSITGLLRNNPVGTLDFVLDDKGNPLSDAEARVRLNKMLEQGQKLLPTSDECVGFDPITGCPGHEPLVGSDLVRAMLKRGDKHVMCFVANNACNVFLATRPVVVHDCTDSGFISVSGCYSFAVAVNNQGEPLTTQEVGL